MSVINTNVNAIIAQNAGVKNTRVQTQAMQQLSTGNRINSAADDAAGLAISTKMTSQIRGLNQAVRNANDGISLIQTAEGALTEVTNMLQRMRELAVQSASDTNTASDRTALNAEFTALRDEINRIGNNTQFNGMNVLDKSFVGNGAGNEGKFIFQVGANGAQTIDISIGDFRTNDGVSAALANSTSTTGAKQAVTVDFATAAAVAAGQNVAFSVTGSDGTTQTLTWTAQTAIAAAGATSTESLVDALVADASNFSSLLGLTATKVDADTIKLEGAAGVTYSLAVTDTGTAVTGTVNSETFSGAVQTDTMTMQALEAGKTTTLTIGDRVLTYTAGSSGATAAEVRTDMVAYATSNFATLAQTKGTFVETSGAWDANTPFTFTAHGSDTTKLVITSDASVSYSASGIKQNGPTGDLQGIDQSAITTQSDANSAVTALDAAMLVVSSGRATMGATINRLNYAADNLLATSANVSASRSRIQDTDYSQATTELARTQIIQQASTAMLAQANQSAQSVLSLLK